VGAAEQTVVDGKRPEDQLRTMLDTIPTLAWSCRPDGTTEVLNQRWLDYTGLSFAEALGWGWKAPSHPDDLGKLMDTWQSQVYKGAPHGLCSTHKEQVNADLLAFFKS
jgi:PAS domain-containing protein